MGSRRPRGRPTRRTAARQAPAAMRATGPRHTTGARHTTVARRATGARIVLALSLCAPPVLLTAPPPAEAATLQVRMKGSAYSPASLTVHTGDTVTWTNLDQVPHDVMTTGGPQPLHSPLLQRGRSWSFTFRLPGTYAYTCSVHPFMRARVTVLAAATHAPRGHTGPASAPPARPGATPGASATASQAASPTASPSAAPAAPSGPAAPSSQPPASNASATSRKSINPLLPMAGLVGAVAVFCLLLLTGPASPRELED
jgi:plastocyanin